MRESVAANPISGHRNPTKCRAAPSSVGLGKAFQSGVPIEFIRSEPVNYSERIVVNKQFAQLGAGFFGATPLKLRMCRIER